MTDWSRIVEEHGAMVWKTAHRLLRNEADAADCFQRTFLAAVEIADREPVRHWPALLRRIATARALEQLRARIRERGRHAPLGAGPPGDGRSDNPLDAVQASELAERMRLALADLDPRQAQVFCLSQLEGLSYSDVAAELGLTTSHVGVLLNRARATLQVQLAAFSPNRAKENSKQV